MLTIVPFCGGDAIEPMWSGVRGISGGGWANQMAVGHAGDSYVGVYVGLHANGVVHMQFDSISYE